MQSRHAGVTNYAAFRWVIYVQLSVDFGRYRKQAQPQPRRLSLNA